MLDPALTSQLSTHLAKITQPVVLASSLDDSTKSGELRELLDELASLSDHIPVEARDDDALVAAADDMIDRARTPSNLIEKVHRAGQTVGRIELDSEDVAAE